MKTTRRSPSKPFRTTMSCSKCGGSVRVHSSISPLIGLIAVFTGPPPFRNPNRQDVGRAPLPNLDQFSASHPARRPGRKPPLGGDERAWDRLAELLPRLALEVPRLR